MNLHQPDGSVVDYRALLKKYINHVGEKEGINFLESRDDYARFTDEEWDELQLIDQELWAVETGRKGK